MPNILVLGANGQLGSDLVKLADYSMCNLIKITRQEVDVLTDDLAEKLSHYQPQYVINCVATTNVDLCEENSDQAFLINSDFSYKLAKFCNEVNAVLIHISTDYVFDGIKSSAYTELDIPNPINIYGLSKYGGEIAIKQYAKRYFIFRVASIFGKAGASGKGGNFITTILRLGNQLDTVNVIADQISCPTATLDIARCIFHFIKTKNDDYGIYHCTSVDSCSWFEFAQNIFKLGGLDINKVQPIKFDSYKFRARRPQNTIMSTDKLSKYYQMPKWYKGLQEYFN